MYCPQSGPPVRHGEHRVLNYFLLCALRAAPADRSVDNNSVYDLLKQPVNILLVSREARIENGNFLISIHKAQQ
ncbi:hypothetical protein SAMN05216167_10469 [Spirosoma endophyticum]|uniref:Uncharacterized protein n=1 Tax=Spirosoma endophyticum TaxID=662367 RepID=A0A1I1QQV9_9BACT|nr:hypothetical protein SAMN05216167_10469 [Spirosoma endophyticum]